MLVQSVCMKLNPSEQAHRTGRAGNSRTQLTSPSPSALVCSGLGLPSPRCSPRCSPRPSVVLGVLCSQRTNTSREMPVRWNSSTRFTVNPSIWERERAREREIYYNSQIHRLPNQAYISTITSWSNAMPVDVIFLMYTITFPYYPHL